MIHARIFNEMRRAENEGEKLTGKALRRMERVLKSDIWRPDVIPAAKHNDRPLIAQFCANDPAVLLEAAKEIEKHADAVDINFGCPQHIAKRGHYGAFLMDDWKLVYDMVKILHDNLSVPVTCKIRVFETVEKTVEYAKMIESAGCQLLAVHGRLREQKGHKTGLADLSKIKAVKDALSIPVFANGNVIYPEDVAECLRQTGADGIMSAEGNLYNPAIFSGREPPVWEMANEYLEICKTVGYRAAYIRAHFFKLYHAALAKYTDFRHRLGECRELEEFEQFAKDLQMHLEVCTI